MRLNHPFLSLLPVLIFIGGFFSGLGQAITLYVAKNGKDSNPGTISSPFFTINQGLKSLKPTGTLVVRGGTYQEILNYRYIPSGVSDSSRTWIKGYPGETVIANGIDVMSRSFVTVQDIVFQGYTNRIGRWTTSDPLATYITFQNVTARDWVGGGSGAGGINVGFRQDGASTFAKILNCSCYHNGTTKLDHGIYVSSRDNLIDGGNFYNNSGHGIQVYGHIGAGSTSNNIVQNTNSHDNTLQGIGIYTGAGIVVRNNTVSNNGYAGIRADYSAQDCQISGNRVSNSPRGILIGPGASNTKVSGNIFSNVTSKIINQGQNTQISEAGDVNPPPSGDGTQPPIVPPITKPAAFGGIGLFLIAGIGLYFLIQD